MDWSKLTLEEGKHVKAVPCVDIVAFSSERPTESGPGFERFMRTFTNRYGDKLTYFRTGDMKSFRRFDASKLDRPSQWFADPSLLTRKLLGFRAHAGNAQKNVVAPGIDMTLAGAWETPRCVFQVSLPVAAADQPDDLVSLALEALADFRLQSGYCGYSLLWNTVDESVETEVCEWAAPLLLRHPGLNYGDAFLPSNATHEGVVVVSWLTFLGKAITADLGGRKDLERRCPAGVSLVPLGAGGCLLRAGAAPALGDVKRGDRLPAQQAVGRLVAPRRASDDALENFVVDGIPEKTASKWRLRFFE